VEAPGSKHRFLQELSLPQKAVEQKHEEIVGNPGRSIQPSFKKKVDQEGAQAS